MIKGKNRIEKVKQSFHLLFVFKESQLTGYYM